MKKQVMKAKTKSTMNLKLKKLRKVRALKLMKAIEYQLIWEGIDVVTLMTPADAPKLKSSAIFFQKITDGKHDKQLQDINKVCTSILDVQLLLRLKNSIRILSCCPEKR